MRRAPFPLRRTALLALALPVMLMACDSNEQTIIINGLDCGLIRADLTGDWVVTFIPGTSTLENCDNPALNGETVSVGPTPLLFPGVLTVASGGSAGFQVFGDGPDPSFTNELFANVEADSCLALVNVWVAGTNPGFFHCFGTFDPVSLFFAVFCDSVEIDADPDDAFFGDTCDLNASLTADIEIFP